ncbi:hypothetical protein LCGC14_1125800 [marine sediment metagenome]|uniref:Uncharacterized protein n=1 Tax=marine sediment metagenome TaxID=412755 RepID=A0A0F9MQL0_9ZZZZ
MDIQAARERCEACGGAVEVRSSREGTNHYVPVERGRVGEKELFAALEALEEAKKIVDILKAHGMNLRVVQVPPPIVDHKRLYALKDAVNAYDAILGERK